MNKPQRRQSEDVPWQKPADISADQAAELLNQFGAASAEPPRLPTRRGPPTASSVPEKRFATHYERMGIALVILFVAAVSSFVLVQYRQQIPHGDTIAAMIAMVAFLAISCIFLLTVARIADLLEERRGP